MASEYSKKPNWRELGVPWFIGWPPDAIFQMIRELAARTGHRVLTSEEADLFRDTPLSDRFAGPGGVTILRLFEQGRPGFVDVAPDLGLVDFSSREFEIPEEFVDDEACWYDDFSSADIEHHWRRLASEITDDAIARSFETGATLYGRPGSILAPFQKIEHDQWRVLIRWVTDWTFLEGPKDTFVYSPHFEIWETETGEQTRTVGAEARAARELIHELRQRKVSSVTKDAVRADALERFRLSKRAFDERVWPAVCEALPELRRQGRRKKSNPLAT
jgi:hypothetical protein